MKRFVTNSFRILIGVAFVPLRLCGNGGHGGSKRLVFLSLNTFENVTHFTL
jgi:hypothetical protein